MSQPLLNRSAIGADLYALRELLNVEINDLKFALGLSHPRWMRLTRDHPDTPISDPTLALLVWAFFNYPDYRFLPQYPDPHRAFGLFRDLGQQIIHPVSSLRRAGRVNNYPVTLNSMRAFGFMLGRDQGAGKRWLDGTSQLNPVTRRLLYLLVKVCEHEQVAGLQQWYERVVAEARWRGIEDLWVQKDWKGVSNTAASQGAQLSARRMIHADILLLMQRYELSRHDISFALGKTVQQWTPLLRDTPQAPIENPTLSLLVWALLTYPQYSYVPQFVSPKATYEQFQATAQGMQHQSTAPTPRRGVGRPAGRHQLATRQSFGLLLGSDAASGRRWVMSESADAQAEVRRLIHFLAQVCQHEGQPGLKKWYERVIAEARWRDIDDLWGQKSWLRRAPTRNNSTLSTTA